MGRLLASRVDNLSIGVNTIQNHLENVVHVLDNKMVARSSDVFCNTLRSALKMSCFNASETLNYHIEGVDEMFHLQEGKELLIVHG